MSDQKIEKKFTPISEIIQILSSNPKNWSPNENDIRGFLLDLSKRYQTMVSGGLDNSNFYKKAELLNDIIKTLPDDFEVDANASGWVVNDMKVYEEKLGTDHPVLSILWRAKKNPSAVAERLMKTTGWIKHIPGEKQEDFIERWMKANSTPTPNNQQTLQEIVERKEPAKPTQERKLRNRTVIS